MKMTVSSPPYFLVNVRSEKSYRMLRYATRGQIDMDDASVASCTLYLKEIISYWTSICFVLDVLVGVLLWRGRLQVSKNRSIWFPIHSILLFAAGVACIERVDLVIPILLLGVSWILVSIKWHLSHKSYPWRRVKGVGSTSLIVFTGASSHSAAHISPNVGVEAGKREDTLDDLKARRMSLIVQLWISFLLKVYRIYSKNLFTSVQFATTEKKLFQLFTNQLQYVHMFLKYICQYSRMLRTILAWRNYSSHRIAMNCFIVGVLWLCLPVGVAVQWILRIAVWTLLGPWMKLVDVHWVHDVYQTKEELQDLIDEAYRDGTIFDLEKKLVLPDFDSLLASKIFLRMSHSGRVNAENLYQLKAMRSYLYGSFSEMIPIRDSSGLSSIPLPASSATPYKNMENKQGLVSSDPVRGHQHWYHVPGQGLRGSMIMTFGKESEGWTGDSLQRASEEPQDEQGLSVTESCKDDLGKSGHSS
jgi:hypothetical protein